MPCQRGCPGARCSSEEMDATPHWELWGGRHRGGARLNLYTLTRRMGTVAVNGSRWDILFDEMCQAAYSMLICSFAMQCQLGVFSEAIVKLIQCNARFNVLLG